jgi:DNA-binding GntR family transcriptional regulator
MALLGAVKLSPADVVTAQDSIVGALQKAILQGELKLGQRILEEELSATFGISRATLRESLRRLEQLGLVQIKPRKGTYVTKLSLEEIERICRMRALLEGLAARYCAANLTDHRNTHLRQIIIQMRKAAKMGDHDAFLDADMRFHQSVWKFAADDQLEHVLKFLSTPYFAFIANVSAHLFTDTEALCQSHERYLEFLQSKEPETVQRQVTLLHEELGQNIVRSIAAKQEHLSHSILGLDE